MIVSWISHDNRKQRRAVRARARRARINLEIHRVVSDDVGDHIVALTHYLITPGKARLDELALIEAAKSEVVRYIGSGKASGDVTAADIEAAREIAESERVVQILTRNLLSSDLADIQFEMAVVAGMAPGVEDPIEHIVVSWREGEHPSPEQVEEVLDIVLAVAGMSRHQAYAVLHGDTDNDHLHIALNRVDPVTGERVQIGRNVERSIETLHQAIAIVEHRQGWAPQDQGLYRADDHGCYDRETGTKVRDAAMLPCASHAERGRIRQWRAEQKIERKISPAARDYERRTGHESLQRRVIATAAPVLCEGRTWDELHRGLAAEGMRYTMLTSGAVIDCGGRTVAASTAWGGASAAKMIERLGAFEEAAGDVVVEPFEDRDLERQLDALATATAMPNIDQAPLDAIAMQPPAMLVDYAPDFTRWIERRADPAISRGRIEAEASAIYANPELRRQLAELQSQQFDFAIELRHMAQRSLSRRQEALAKYQADWPDEPLRPFGRLPRLSDLTPDPEKLKGMVDFAPLPAANEGAIHNADGVASRVAPDDGKAEVTRDLDRRYRQWADRNRRRQDDRIARERAAALRARAGDPAEPPRHIARLLLREAARVRASRSPFDRATDRRDAQEIAALRHDPEFARSWAQARGQDPELIERLKSVDSTGDALGRVRLSRDRLNFAHVSDSGHDSGAQPPLEWIEADLRKLDFTRIRLTRRDGQVGISDPDLLDATHHNHVGLLYPQVQARLELEMRLQHERDLAVLAKIAVGEITLTAKIDMAAMPYATIDLPRGASNDERRHIATMAHDPDGFLALRAAVHGEPPGDAPLHASPLESAWLRAGGEPVAPDVMALMKERLRVELSGIGVERVGHRPVGVERARSRALSVRRDGHGRGD